MKSKTKYDERKGKVIVYREDMFSIPKAEYEAIQQITNGEFGYCSWPIGPRNPWKKYDAFITKSSIPREINKFFL